MDVSSYALESGLYILVLELKARLVRIRDDEKVEAKREQCDQSRRKYVRNHHPVETDSAGQDGDDLRVGRHLGSEEYHRNEHEQRGEHVHEVRDEVQIIVEYDCMQRRFLCHEIVYLLADVEDDDDSDDQKQRNEERRDELRNDV